ncbi:MAG: HEAT repeat domain-containing protein [Nitrospinae bacterium]|nr:HEAT repeat domain-containing protein [Nitrospinota bacterium]
MDKETLQSLIREGRYEEALAISCHAPGFARALMSFLFTDEELLFWRTVKVFGLYAARDAETSSRFVRRLMWQLNDESGSIGRGSAHVIGEMAVNNYEVVKTAAPVVVHYLEDEGMLPGVLYAIGRIGSVRPEVTKDVIPELVAILEEYEDSPKILGMAAWALGRIGAKQADVALRGLLDNGERFSYYDPEEDLMKNAMVEEMARCALERLG